MPFTLLCKCGSEEIVDTSFPVHSVSKLTVVPFLFNSAFKMVRSQINRSASCVSVLWCISYGVCLVVHLLVHFSGESPRFLPSLALEC